MGWLWESHPGSDQPRTDHGTERGHIARAASPSDARPRTPKRRCFRVVDLGHGATPTCPRRAAVHLLGFAGQVHCSQDGRRMDGKAQASRLSFTLGGSHHAMAARTRSNRIPGASAAMRVLEVAGHALSHGHARVATLPVGELCVRAQGSRQWAALPKVPRLRLQRGSFLVGAAVHLPAEVAPGRRGCCGKWTPRGLEPRNRER